MGLQHNAILIKKHKFDGHGLNRLAERHLEDMGIDKVGERFDLLREIDNFRKQASLYESGDVILRCHLTLS